MAQEITVAVVDDHPLVRDGVVQAIAGTEGFTVVADGETAADAVRIIHERAPDILLIDLSIPGSGREAIRQISEEDHATRIVVLSGSDAPDDLMDTLALGALGYVLKGVTGDELVEALRIVVLGGYFVSPQLAGQVLSKLARGYQAAAGGDLSELTGRDLEIAQMVGQGQSNKLIAHALGLSEKTIKHYLTGIFRKANVSNRVELARKMRSTMHP